MSDTVFRDVPSKEIDALVIDSLVSSDWIFPLTNSWPEVIPPEFCADKLRKLKMKIGNKIRRVIIMSIWLHKDEIRTIRHRYHNVNKLTI
jgi:hypothetical protein